VERPSGAAPPRRSGGIGATEPLTVRVERSGTNASIISLAGELDLSTIPTVEGRLLKELGSGRAVILDLDQLAFIDSSGIGLLIQAFRTTDDNGRLRTVIAQGSQVERVFRLAGVDRVLPIFLDRDEALAANN
jgi:anti-anti-sigma factor